MSGEAEQAILGTLLIVFGSTLLLSVLLAHRPRRSRSRQARTRVYREGKDPC